MAAIQHHNGAASKPVPYFSHAVTDGDYAFLSGQLAADAVAPVQGRGDVAAETRATIDLLEATLAELCLGFADVVSARVYLTEPEKFRDMNRVYASYFEPTKLPARTCVGVTWLAGEALVEIECVARLRG